MSMQQWPGGQQPMMRAAEADRERVADVLKAGFAEGRLTKEELDQRLTRLPRAATYGELHAIIADLPQGAMPTPAHYAPMPQPSQPHYHAPPWTAPTNGLAIGALVCGILGVFSWGLFSLPAVVLGHIARPQIRRSGERGDGMAVTGLVLGYLGIAFWVLILLVFSAVMSSVVFF
jgi:hypothetical protein